MIESEPAHFHVYQPIGNVVTIAPQPCYMQFQHVLAKDYGTNKFSFSSQTLNLDCIDMDEWEKSRGGKQDCTMDCAIALYHYNDQTGKLSSPRCLLVEFKLGIVRFNLSKTDLSNKVTHSQNMLAPSTVHQSAVFIVPKSIRSQAEYQCKQWQRGTNGNLYKRFKFTDSYHFNDFIKFISDFPYNPINNPKGIENELIKFHSRKDYNGLDSRLDKWKQTYIKTEWNIQERENIRMTIIKVLAAIIPNINDADNKKYYELIADEWENL